MRRTTVVSLLLVVNVLLLGASPTGVVSAGVNVWTSHGPEGGAILALAIDPATTATLYAGTGGGVFKSTNGGANWFVASTGLTNIVVVALAIDPATPTTLYAGTDAGGVFKSTNGGAQWSAVNIGLPASYVGALAIDPATPTTLYAGTEYYGVFRSANGGASWSAVNAGLTSRGVRALAIDPATPTTLYAGSFDRGVFKSVDGGENWNAVNTGLTASYVSALAIDPVTPTTLYVGTLDGGVFRSSNGGRDWSAVNTGLAAASVKALRVDPVAPTTLYAATYLGGVFKTVNGGGSWSAANAGLTNTRVRALAIDPVTPTTLYAGTSAGLFKAGDGGGNWREVNAGLTAQSVLALVIDPAAPATLYAGTEGGAIFRGSNRGGNWSAVNTGLTAQWILALAIDPQTSTTLYAGTDRGVFKTTDGGAGWSLVNSGLGATSVHALTIDPATPTTVYAGAYEAGVFKSTDGGENWRAVNTGLTNPQVCALAIDPATPATLYAGTEGGGVFKSTNGGGNWSEANTGLSAPRVHALAIDPATPTTLYAGTYFGGVFQSTNGGGSWSAINNGLTALWVVAMAIDPLTPTTLYAGTYFGGVFQSTNGGGSWSALNAGLTSKNVRALAIDPATPSTLYAATTGAGVFDLQQVRQPQRIYLPVVLRSAQLPPPAPAAIEIGASIPLTGKYASLGEMVKAGYEIAVVDINAAGGVYVAEHHKKIPLHLTVCDDESDLPTAFSNLEMLYSEQKVVVYLGGVGNDLHAVAAGLAEKNRVPYLGVGYGLQRIHQQGYKYLFSPFPKSPDLARDVFEVLNELIPEGQRPTKVAIFQETTDWGAELGDLWRQNAVTYGYQIVTYEEYAQGTKDMSTMILKAKAAGAETLLTVPNTPDGTTMIKQMAEQGWTPKFTLMIRAPENVAWATNLGRVGDNLTLFPGWHYGENLPGVAELNAKYQAQFGRPADLLTGPAYACVQIAAAAIEKAGTLERDKIRDAIAATNMTTVIGPVTFNADGTGNVLNPLVQWQNGQMELVWPREQSTFEWIYPAPPFEERKPAADIQGMKVCYLIPALANTFLNNLSTSVKAQAAADGVEVFVYGADEGGMAAQFNQVQTCIAMRVNAMILMAAGEITGMFPSVQAAQAAGIKVIGVPPGDLEPFDAIMHTDQLEDGTLMAEMGCGFINRTYPDAADHSVEVAIIGNPSGGEQMKLRWDGMNTITNCVKANVVQTLDLAEPSISAAASAAANILTAHPMVKVFLVHGSAGAQGVSQTIKALPNVDVSQYGVFAGDMDPIVIPTVTSCQDPYKGLIAIGGPGLDKTTYKLLKYVLQGVDYPKIVNDVLVPTGCGIE